MPSHNSNKELFLLVILGLCGIRFLLSDCDCEPRVKQTDTISSLGDGGNDGCLTWNLEEAIASVSASGVRDKSFARRVFHKVTQNAQLTGLQGAEVGVYKGDFAKEMLSLNNDAIQRYILVDPWRHLDNWNKPFNKDDNEFEAIYQEAMSKTLHVYGRDKITVLRDTSKRGAQQVPDRSLDFIYIDGDHTAKGAMKDILLWVPKLKCGGLVMGDDFEDNLALWRTGKGEFDPTMVSSAVAAYAEAYDITVNRMGNNQFAFLAK